ncbi:MAG: CRTAC1 family protein [Acidobacteriota bacterium]|nr:CRTAC1 family protein [Acidobacteriota bacterium]
MDVTAAAGIDFVHSHGGSGERYMVETMGSGGGFFDLDGDGWLDLYLVQGAPLPGFEGTPPGPDRIYRNRGPDEETGGLAFDDVTDEVAGENADFGRGYGMGVCFGDVDNDGFTDVYVTHYGPHYSTDRLYRNDGGRRLVDVTAAAGIDNPQWGASCAFADADGDGCLDLYVVNYVDATLENHRRCEENGLHVYCHPDVYRGVPDRLYRNRCQGPPSFEDATAALGPQDAASAKGLGVVWTDFDDDGDADIYVSNDSTRNFLYANESSPGTLRFREVGVASGTAFNDQGVTEAGMGVDAGDVDGDGRFDLFTAHLDFETNTLYRNQGGGFFLDATAQAALAAPSLRKVGFGSNFFDVDNDSDLDLFVANGHILDNIAEQKPSLSYGQRDQLFVNDGSGRFSPAGPGAGSHFQRRWVGRGSAAGDVDNDGDLDLLITHCGQPAVLLENRIGDRKPGLILALESRHGGRDAIGAKVTLTTADGRRLVEESRSGSSYLSQGDLRVHFGLGDRTAIESLEIRWPEGEIQRLDGTELGDNGIQAIRQETP